MAPRGDKYKHFSVLANDGGGQLIAGSNSQDTAGTSNYVEKINLRRETDGEVRREGWESFAVDRLADELTQDGESYGTSPIRLIHQFESDDELVLVAASADKIYRYSVASGWMCIASGLHNIDKINLPYEGQTTGELGRINNYVSTEGELKSIRWEVVSIDGYCIFNNGVDLPLYYRGSWPSAFPMFSLRERGIIRVGTITEFDGRLFLANIEYFDESDSSQQDFSLNLYDFLKFANSPYFIPEGYVSGKPECYTSPHTLEFSAKNLVLDIGETRSAPNLFQQNYVGEISHLDANNNIKQVTIPYQMGGTRQKRFYEASGFADSNINGRYYAPLMGDSRPKQTTSGDPIYYNSVGYRMFKISGDWGIFSPSATSFLYRNTNDIPYFGSWVAVNGIDPVGTVHSHWPLASEVFNPYQSNLDLYISGELFDQDHNDYRYSTILEGDTVRVTVRDALNQLKVFDLVVGKIESDYYSSVTYIDVVTAYPAVEALTNEGEEQADSTIFAPAVGNRIFLILLKEPDPFSEVSGNLASNAMSFPEDGSKIVKMAKLADQMMVYRQTGYISVSRGDAAQAFFFEERYRGERVADFRNTIININEQRQMFIGLSGAYVISLSSYTPVPLSVINDGPQFWRQATVGDIEYIYAAQNSLTDEIFINCPIGLVKGITSKINDWGILAIDLIRNTLSQIDHSLTAMANVLPQGSDASRLFLMGVHIADKVKNIPNVRFTETEDIDQADAEHAILGSRIVVYGYGSTVERGPYRVFSRDGRDYKCYLTYGKSDFGDRFSEKKLRSYALHLSDTFQYSTYVDGEYVADDYLDSAVVVDISIDTFATSQIQAQEEITQEIEDLANQVMVPLYAQGNYFQDKLVFSGLDKAFKILGRTFEVSGVRTKLTSEVVTSGS